MIKVLIANGHLNAGGVEKSLITFLRAINYEKYQVDLLLFEGLGDYRPFVPDKVNIIDWNLTETYGSFLQVGRKAVKERRMKSFLIKCVLMLGNKFSMHLLRLLSTFHMTEREYDYAIAYRVGMPADYVTYAVHAKKKMIWWHNGKFDYGEKLISAWGNEFNQVDNVVCVSEFSRAMLQQHFPKLSDKFIVVPNMIDISEIYNLAEKFDPYEKDKCNTIIVSVGRLSKEKHMMDCVAVAHRLEDACIDFKWYLVGDGEEKEAIEGEIGRLRLQEKVILIGNKPNPYPYIKYASIFVHPSYVESQGIAVLEAMAFGIPCVVTKSGGTNEFVRDGVNAVQAEWSIDSLFEKVKYAIQSHVDFREAEMDTARRYEPEHIIDQIFDL